MISAITRRWFLIGVVLLAVVRPTPIGRHPFMLFAQNVDPKP